MLDSLDRIITILELPAIVVCLGLWIFALVSLIRSRTRRRAFVAMAGFALGVTVMMTLGSIMTIRARKEVLAFLDEKNAPFTLYVQGQQVPDVQADSLASLLRSVRRLPAHHSHPTDAVVIKVVDAKGRVVNLELRRDSDVPTEYWFYRMDYETTSNNPLGRVVTPLFDDL